MNALNSIITPNGISIPWLNTYNSTEYQTNHELRYAIRKKKFDCHTLHPSRNIPKENKLKQKTISTIEQYSHQKEDDYYSMTTNRNNTTSANTNDVIDIKHSSFRPHKIVKFSHNQRPPSKITKPLKCAKESYQIITHTEQNITNKPLIIRKIDDNINKLLQNNIESYTVTEGNFDNSSKCKGRNKYNSLTLPFNYTTTNQYDLNTNNTSNKLKRYETNDNMQCNEVNAYMQYVQTVNKQPETLIEILKEHSDMTIKQGQQLNIKEKKRYVGNKYLDELLRRVTRRVDYISQKNNVISEDEVMNLLRKESDRINANVDKLMMATCFIKNFSLAFKDGNDLLLLPMINSIKPYENDLNVNEVNQNQYINNAHNQDEYMKSIENVLMKGFKLNSNLIPINEKRDEGLKLSESLASLYNRDSPQQAKSSKFQLIKSNQSPIKSPSRKINVKIVKSKSYSNYKCNLIQNWVIIRKCKSMESYKRNTVKNIDFVLLTEDTKKGWLSMMFDRSGSSEMKSKFRALYGNKLGQGIIKQKSGLYNEKDKENSQCERRYKNTDKKDYFMSSKFNKESINAKENHDKLIEKTLKPIKQQNTIEKTTINCNKEIESCNDFQENNNNTTAIKTTDKKRTEHDLFHESQMNKSRKETIEKNKYTLREDEEVGAQNNDDNDHTFHEYNKKNRAKLAINKSKYNITKNHNKTNKKTKYGANINEEEEDVDIKSTYKPKEKQNNTKIKSYQKPKITQRKKKDNKIKLKNSKKNHTNNEAYEDQLNDNNDIQADFFKEKQISILEEQLSISPINDYYNSNITSRNEIKRTSKYERPSIIPPYYQQRISQPLIQSQIELHFRRSICTLEILWNSVSVDKPIELRLFLKSMTEKRGVGLGLGFVC